MELLSLQAPPFVSSSTSSSKGLLVGRRQVFSHNKPHNLCLSNGIRNYPPAKTPRIFDFAPPAAGNVMATIGSSAETTEGVTEEMPLNSDVVFVAGATGRVGSRTVRELLKLGFRVRAGVRSVERAESLVQSVQQMKLDDASGSASGVQPAERLEIVQCDIENQGEIGRAVGSASIVICCIGASEKEVFDVTGPYRIDYKATKNLIDVATSSKVNHFILLTSLGTSKFGLPAAILNLFWGVLCWKRRAEEALIASGLPYTIVRPGGMERPTDAYKETHNLVLGKEDVYFGGQVSNLQVAELMAFVAKNRNLSFCKVVEVIAETTAPLLPMEKLLSEIPSQRVDTSPPKVPQETPKPDPTPRNISTEDSEPTIDEPDDDDKVLKPQQPQSLSPYAAYADLKPPTSPSPTPGSPKTSIPPNITTDSTSTHVTTSSNTTGNDPVPVVMPKVQPLSPYTSYDDLKPPTSPTPTPSTSPASPTKANAATEPKTENSSPTETSRSKSESTQQPIEKPKQNSLSPYAAYADLKPPTSPTPTPSSPIDVNAATESAPAKIVSSSMPEATDIEKESTQLPIQKQKSQSLSPYAAYADLKPPASPCPSLPRN